MAGKKISQTIEYQGVFDASQVLSTMDQIRKKLEMSGVKPDFLNVLNKDFDKIVQKATKLNAQLSEGFKSSADVAKFEKEASALTQSISLLSSGVERLRPSFADIEIPDDIKKDIDDISGLIKTLEGDLKKVQSTGLRIEGFKNLVPKDAIGDIQNFSKLLVDNIYDEEEFQKLIQNRKNTLEESIKAEEQDLQTIVQKTNQLKEIEAIQKRINESKSKVSKADRDAIEKFKLPGYDRNLGKKDTLALLETQKPKLTKDEENKLRTLEKNKQAMVDLVEFESQAFKLRSESLQKEENITKELEKQQLIRTGKTSQVLQDTKEKIEEVAKETEGYGKTTKETFEKETTSIEQSVSAMEKKDKITESLTSKVGKIFGLTKAWELVQKTIRDALNTVKEVDQEFTAIAVVTDKNTKQMWGTFETYNKMAQQLGVSTKDAIATSKLFYQQGLQTNEVMTLTTETIKMAKIAGMDFKTATDQMTAALRGFKLEMSDAARVNDVFSSLAARAAVDTQELSYALTKTASIANSAGMELETTSAFLTQMINFTILRGIV